jgi:hypothetical protein
VKARFLRAVCERRPDERECQCLAINTQLGFVPHRDVRTFQITRGAIEATLARRRHLPAATEVSTRRTSACTSSPPSDSGQSFRPGAWRSIGGRARAKALAAI